MPELEANLDYTKHIPSLPGLQNKILSQTATKGKQEKKTM